MSDDSPLSLYIVIALVVGGVKLLKKMQKKQEVPSRPPVLPTPKQPLVSAPQTLKKKEGLVLKKKESKKNAYTRDVKKTSYVQTLFRKGRSKKEIMLLSEILKTPYF